jgi:medium-chain acyl-[acyl-carrier-protein] hydrolase
LANAIVEVLLPLLDAPFAFFGHSMGAVLAFRVAKTLEENNQLQAQTLFVSGARPPHIEERGEKFHHLGDLEFVERLREMQGTPEEILANADALQAYLPFIRADFQALEEYQPRLSRKLKCPITGFAGTRDPLAPARLMHAWQDLTEGSYTHREIVGDHFFITNLDSQFLDLLASDLDEVLRQ